MLGGHWDATLLVASLLLLTGSAWLALWYLGDSPYAHLFHAHGASVRTSGQVSNAVFGLLFVGGWILMTIAMMLPTSIPLLVVFHSICRARANPLLLTSLAVLGYLAAWLAFGVTAYVAAVAIARAAHNLTWIQSRPWTLTAGILLLAGLYQFSPLKYRCLDKCRSPFAFVAGHWHGGQKHAEAFHPWCQSRCFLCGVLLGVDASHDSDWCGQSRLDVDAGGGDGSREEPRRGEVDGKASRRSTRNARNIRRSSRKHSQHVKSF